MNGSHGNYNPPPPNVPGPPMPHFNIPPPPPPRGSFLGQLAGGLVFAVAVGAVFSLMTPRNITVRHEHPPRAQIEAEWGGKPVPPPKQQHHPGQQPYKPYLPPPEQVFQQQQQHQQQYGQMTQQPQQQYQYNQSQPAVTMHSFSGPSLYSNSPPSDQKRDE